jgi:hypothetical protein
MPVKTIFNVFQKRIGLFISFLFIILIPGLAFSQSITISSTFNRVIDVAQKAYGPDDLLVNGSLYVPDHPKA